MGANPYGPPPETPEQVGNRRGESVMTALPAAPLMHGAAQWAALINLYGGGKTVLTKGSRSIWRRSGARVQSQA